MRVRVLGSVEVCGHAGTVSPPQRQRTLLSLLLIGKGSAVPVERLIEEIWGSDQPGDPAGQLYTHVAHLRRILRDRGGEQLQTRSRAYALVVDSDLMEFERLAEEGAYAEALALWRGEPFANAGETPMVQAEAARLAKLRLDLLEERLDADLAAGMHHALAAELWATAAEHPLRERIWGQLMLALYRCGRQAEALQAYQQVRRTLGDELGLRPGPELWQLHQRILDNDPALDPPPRSSDRVPRQLPPVVAGFTGRAEPLARIGVSPVTVVSGMGGVGKTALAVYWAHQQGDDRFCDGDLYIDLRGYGPGDPLTPRAAMESVCRRLGAEELPVDSEELAGLFRSSLAGRRMLLLLDNARSVDQVRPLLPGRGDCTTVVTSRDDLAGLVAREGAARVRLDRLAEAESLELLASILDGDAATSDRSALSSLVRACAGLPLALRIAAERAQHRRGTLAELVAEFAERPTLNALEVPGDPESALRTVFSWSYRHLAPSDARLFGLLGRFPGSQVDERIAANLADVDVETARKQLDVLARAHLIEPTGIRGRFRMHDLIRAYAAELAPDDTGPLVRLLDYYLHAAETAADVLNPDRVRVPHDLPPPATPPPTFADEQSALEWLGDEDDNITATVGNAADAGLGQYPWRICNAVWHFYQFTLRRDAWLTTHTVALASAKAAADRIGEAWTTARLGMAYSLLDGDHEQAVQYQERAVRLFHSAGDRAAEARTRYNLAVCLMSAGRYAEAESEAQRTGAIFGELAEPVGTAMATGLLIELHIETGLVPDDLDRCNSALSILRREGARHITASLMHVLGKAHRIAGNYDEALAILSEVVTEFGELGDQIDAAYAGYDIAETHLARGDGVEAIRRATEGLDNCPPTQVNLRAALTGLLCLAHARNGDRGVAAELTDEAAVLLRDRPFDRYHAAASQHLGETQLELGDIQAAEHHLRTALQISEDLGLARRRGLAHRALREMTRARQCESRSTTAAEASGDARSRRHGT